MHRSSYCGLLAIACAACATGARQLDLDDAALKPVPLHEYRVADLRPAQTKRGPGYAFLLTGANDPRPLWSARGSGRVDVVGGRIAVSEEVELKPARDSRRPWSLQLRSTESFRIAGVLENGERTFEIDSVPEGSLPLGEYGARTIVLLERGRVVATVDLEKAVVAKSSLGADDAPLLGTAVAAIALRRRVLRATGALSNSKAAVGLSDFQCVTFTCDHRVNADGTTTYGQEQVSESYHWGRR